MTIDRDMLNASQAALLGAHVETIQRPARCDEIPSFKVGKDRRFRRASERWWGAQVR